MCIDRHFNKAKDTMAEEVVQGFVSDDGINDPSPNGEETAETLDVCPECGRNPCVAVELEETLVAMRDLYMGWKTNKQTRFLMYRECCNHIHGTALGKGVRRKLPNCVVNRIRLMLPDESYTGFLEARGHNE